MDFTKRCKEIELMDELHLKKVELNRVLRDIDRANRLLGGNRITLQAVSRILKENPAREFSIIDIGCGAGSMLRALAQYGRKLEIKLNLIGIDLNQEAIEIAKEQSKNFPEISYLNQNILSMELKPLDADIILCTLTMHHFKDKELPILLNKMTEMATLGVVINDLQRSRWGYYLFKVFSAIFIRTYIAKHDGLISIRSGFIWKELKNLSAALPELHHSIQSKWAFRYAWVIRTDQV